MEISSREWAVALLMIRLLQQKCDVLNGMFGDLTVRLSQSGVGMDSMRSLEEDWKKRWKTKVEEIIVQKESVEHISDTGVFQGERSVTIEDVFDHMLSEAVEQLKSDRED